MTDLFRKSRLAKPHHAAVFLSLPISSLRSRPNLDKRVLDKHIIGAIYPTSYGTNYMFVQMTFVQV